MGFTLLVQVSIGHHHFWLYPCPDLTRSFRLGTKPDHFIEILVYFDLQATLRNRFDQGLFEGTMQFELGHRQNHPGVSAPPQNGLPLAVPRKDALLISLYQPTRR
jgi:hypothetical protein